jgi:hypothetical protein
LAIVNDVIAFYPEDLQDKMETYTLHNGVDWLYIADQGLNHERLLGEALEAQKESFETQLEILHASCAERLELINFLDYEVRSLKAEKIGRKNDDDTKKPKKGLLRRFKN